MQQPLLERRLPDPNLIETFSDWQVDFRQLEPGPMTTTVMVRPGDCLTLLGIEMDRAVHQTGASPRDKVTVGLPLSASRQPSSGAAIAPAELLNFGSGDAFEAVSQANFRGLTVSVAEAVLVRVSDSMRLPLAEELVGSTAQPVRRSTRSLEQIAVAGWSLLSDSQAVFGQVEQEDFLAWLASACCDGVRHDDRSRLTRRGHSVRSALDYMAHHAGQGISISDICIATGASWRTLDRGFRESFGLAPKAYLNRLRLSRVRSELLVGSPSQRVVDAANAWGFWHMGQFARDYRRMFGELPSETLAAATSGQRRHGG